MASSYKTETQISFYMCIYISEEIFHSFVYLSLADLGNQYHIITHKNTINSQHLNFNRQNKHFCFDY